MVMTADVKCIQLLDQVSCHVTEDNCTVRVRVSILGEVLLSMILFLNLSLMKLKLALIDFDNFVVTYVTWM